MKNYLLTLLLITSLAFTAKSQYVTIPDPNFVTFLQTNYPQCMNGNQMDTTCSAILSDTLVDCSYQGILSIEGIQYFKNLRLLDCNTNNLNTLPILPPSLLHLKCYSCGLTSVSILPSTLKDIDFSYNNLTSLPTLPLSLNYLDCKNNNLNALPTLPTSLLFLSCSMNQLISLPILPTSLTDLSCNYNNLSNLPTLPSTLLFLNTGNNPLSFLPNLPSNLNFLDIRNANLTTIPTLPNGLAWLYMGGNSITVWPIIPQRLYTLDYSDSNYPPIPSLPTYLLDLICNNANISILPPLPTSLRTLSCYNNQITALPSMPDKLYTLYCNNNFINELPTLPHKMDYLFCNNNLLTKITNLPDTIVRIVDFTNNPNLNCLPHIGIIHDMHFLGTNITCLPNRGRVIFSTPLVDTLPLCDPFNSNMCLVYWNISGKTYQDLNNDCFNSTNDIPLQNIKHQLLINNNILQQSYSNSQGYFSFDVDSQNIYNVTIDTLNASFITTCPIDKVYSDTITAFHSLFYNNDFALNCKPGFDVGINTISSIDRFRPGNNSSLNINAGDITNFYGAHCAAGVAGAVTVVINGPAHYTGPANGALTPTTVNGDTITWDVTDFGAVNALTDFNIVVQTDTTAPIGSQVCFTVNVTPIVGDNNPTNNTLTHCFTISNSYDPNEKEVYPTANIDTAQEWLTYTVHFQNTGTAEAQHIYVMDTLDANVYEGSFQLLAYSHQPNVQINEKIVRFNFPNINLPDSTTDEPNSHGYVQYKVKLKHSLPIGTQISNTAYIYFDFNSPVVTNTVTNTIAVDTSVTIGLPVLVNDLPFDVTLYPNPANQQFSISATAAGSNVIIYNTVGNVVANFTMRGTAQTFNIGNLPSGVYIVKVTHGARATGIKRLVKY